MRNKFWIIVGILAGLMLVGYLLALISTSPTDTSSANEAPGQHQRSWLGDMIHAWNVTRPIDDGIQREGSNRPDADTSQCHWQNLSPDQMITTQFARHILQYPCTAKHQGFWKRHYNQANKLIREDYHLWLGLYIGEDREPIWWDGRTESLNNEKKGFKVELSSDGKKISHEPIKKWIADATKIAEFESINITLYLNGNDIKGFISNAMNDEDGYPNLGCTGSTAERALDIFDPSHPPFERAVCRGRWALNEYIRVVVLMFDSDLAREFNFFYKKIDQGLKDIIVSEPRGTKTSM